MPASGLVISQIQDVMIVDFRVASIVDGPSIEAIAKDLYHLVDAQARKKIVLDFNLVKFLSSQMLGVLVNLMKKAQAIGGRYIITGMRPELHKVFRITKLDKLLEFAPSEDKALKSFGVQLDG